MTHYIFLMFFLYVLNIHNKCSTIMLFLLSCYVSYVGNLNYDALQVQEVLDELGHSGIPLSVISKAAEIQLLDVVDKVLLGNKWLRKATGIQPKFPYLVDSFENRYIYFIFYNIIIFSFKIGLGMRPDNCF